MDSYLIERFNTAVGKLQERGFGLPSILEQTAAFALFVLVLWVGAVFVHQSYVLAVVIALANSILLYNLYTEYKEYRSDVGRMDILTTFKKYALKAAFERHDPASKYSRMLAFVFGIVSLPMTVLSFFDAGNPTTYLYFGIFTFHMLTLAIHAYCQCVEPKPPKYQEEDETELAYARSRG